MQVFQRIDRNLPYAWLSVQLFGLKVYPSTIFLPPYFSQPSQHALTFLQWSH